MSNNSVPKQPAIFLHIHKTAGTTLHAILQRQYAQEDVYAIDTEGKSLEHLTSLSQSQRAKIRLLKGHMDFGLHEFLPQPATYFTFLREPIERAISYYYFIQRTPQHPHFQAANELNLYEFVDQKVDRLMANGQTRQLAGGYPDYDFDEQAEAVLNKAKQHLQERFVVVGITERFDESLLLLQRHFGWRNIWYQRQNVGDNRPKRASIDPKTLTILERQNQIDKELYHYGRSLFKSQVAQQGSLFPYRVRIFRWLNQFTKPYWQLRQYSIRAQLHKLRTS